MLSVIVGLIPRQPTLFIEPACERPNHPSVAKSLNNLANLNNIQGRYKEAEPLFRRALPILEKSLGATHPNVGTLVNNLGALYNAQGKYSESEPLLKRALAIKEKALGPNHPDVVETLNNLANIYNIREQYRQSERFAKGTDALANVVRERQELIAKWDRFDKQLISSFVSLR